MPEIGVREKPDDRLEIEIDGRFTLEVFESGGVYSGGRTGKTTILLRPAIDKREE
jgi:hypothetical protein